MEYNISGRINFDDYVHFNKYLLRRYTIIRLAIFAATLVLVVFVFAGDNSGRGFSFTGLNTLALVTAILIFYSMIRLVFSMKRFRKLYDSNKTIEEECRYAINEKGVTIHSASGSSALTKDAIFKIIIDKDYIYLFKAANMAQIIKSSFCRDAEEYGSLVSFIRERYGEKLKVR